MRGESFTLTYDRLPLARIVPPDDLDCDHAFTATQMIRSTAYICSALHEGESVMIVRHNRPVMALVPIDED